MDRLARLAAWALAAALTCVAPAQAQPGHDDADGLDGAAREDARLLVEERAGAGYARREAITRTLVAMDDRAIAALVVAKRSKSAATRAWAADTLESMGRERADEQIRTRSDETLAQIFRAYGEVHDPDALGVLSSFVGSDRGAIRDAARDALSAYGRDAISTIRQGYAELTGKPAPTAWSPEETARALFAASDRIRLRDVYALLDEGLARADAGDLRGATADLDAVLARQPDTDRRADVARVYAAYGMTLEESDPAGARAYLERAGRVDPDSGTPEIASALAVLEARDLEARGLDGDALYRRALALDPSNPRARAPLDRLEARRALRRRSVERWTIGIGLSLATLLALVLFVGRRKVTPGRRSPPAA